MSYAAVLKFNIQYKTKGKSIGVAEGSSGGSEEPLLGGSNHAQKYKPVLLIAYF